MPLRLRGSRFAPLATTASTAILALILVVACGGADKQDVLDEAPGATSGTSSTSTSSSSSTGGASSSGASSTGGIDAGGTSSGGPSCDREKEPNDNQGSANTLVTSLCGTITSAGDVDFLTFTLPSSAKGVNLGFSGSVVLRVSVDGANAVTLKAGSTQPIPFVKGRPYLVEIRAEAKADWKVTLNIQ